MDARTAWGFRARGPAKARGLAPAAAGFDGPIRTAFPSEAAWVVAAVADGGAGSLGRSSFAHGGTAHGGSTMRGGQWMKMTVASHREWPRESRATAAELMLSIVIPTLNEAENIAAMVKALQETISGS